MPESTNMETEKKAAMDYAIRLAERAVIAGTDARQLAERANLVCTLYQAMIGYDTAKTDVVDALLKAS